MSDAVATPPADTPEHRQALLGGPQKLALLIGVGGLIAFLALAGIVFSGTDSEAVKKGESPSGIQQVFLSYLTGFTFWTLVGIGSLFFLLVQYVTGGRWGILLRRPLEANAKLLGLSVLLFIPIAATMSMGKDSIYWWARHHSHGDHHEEKKEEPKAVAAEGKPSVGTIEKNWLHKQKHTPKKFNNVHPELEVDEANKVHDWLTPGFSVARGFAYLAVFLAVVGWMWKNASTAEYHPDLKVAAAARDRQKYVGSIGLFVFAIVLTWIATDWIMSLEETFASSMFPVIMFDNAALSAYAIGVLTLLYLKAKGEKRFEHLFPAGEQIHLGSLMLAFTLAWTYFNFSQYMLIWIGNLAEEVSYYAKRTREGWEYYAIGAVIFHFPIPFLLLLFRRVKSSPRALRNIAILLLCVIFIDVMWWVQPVFSHAGSPKIYWLMDVAAWVGVGGLWVAAFLWQLKKHPLLPTREVYLLEAYHHGH